MSRRSSSIRLTGWVGLVLVLMGALAVTAFALTRGDGPKPPKRSLPAAIHAALVGPRVAGVTATVTFQQHLLPNSSSFASQASVSGATGRVWVAGGHARIRLSTPMGTVQAAFDGRRITLFVPRTHTAYVFTVPAHRSSGHAGHHAVPSTAQIAKALARVSRVAVLSGADPGNVAGRPAYTVRVSPRHDAGLLGAAELAWDAQHGTPLRFAIYPKGSSTAAIELDVTKIHYGAIPASTLALHLPPGTQIVPVHRPAKQDAKHAGAVQPAQAAPSIVAPATAAGLPRTELRTLDVRGHAGRLVVYGHGLAAVVVLAQPAVKAGGLAQLPTTSVAGTTGRVLETTLGSVVRFTRGGVTYTVAGFQPVETVKNVAAALN
jgi:hypothetical protein